MPDAPTLVVAVPLLAAVLLAALPQWRPGVWVSVAASVLTFALACRLPWVTDPGGWLLADGLAAHLAILTSFIGMTTAAFNMDDAVRVRWHPALFQALLGCLMLAALADGVALTWLALTLAVIAAVTPMALRGRTPGLRRCALLVALGLASALVGTVLLIAAALPVGVARWSALVPAAALCDGRMLSLAFVFLLLGYGTVAAMAPLHGWFTALDAGPATAMLAGSVLNVAAGVLLRLRGVLDGSPSAIPPGSPMMALGLATLLLAAMGSWRRRGVWRLVGLSSVGQTGLVVFAFGLGGADAVFAGLLQMTLYALVRTAVLQGCVHGGRMLVAAGLLALAGAPPFGLFSSQFLLVVAAVHRAPMAALPLVLGVALAGCAMLAAVRFPAGGRPGVTAVQLGGAWLHMALAVGLAMPGAALRWMQGIAAAAQ